MVLLFLSQTYPYNTFEIDYILEFKDNIFNAWVLNGK